MQHSALYRRTSPAAMRHRVEAAKSSAAPRPPFPSTAQTVTGLSEPFFVSPPQPVLPFVAFADAKCCRKKGGIGRKDTHFFVISRNFFEQVPVHDPMRPDNAHDQSAPQRL